MALHLPYALIVGPAPPYQHSSLVDGAYVVLTVVVLALAMAYRVMLARATYSDWDSTSHESKVNCPSCGARTSPDPPVCGYCDEPLDENPPSADS